MSLTGNLEDLGLGDILQIISLSRKSGSLRISSAAGEARIVFREGQVCGAQTPSSPPDLCAMVTVSGTVSKDEYKSAQEAAEADGRLVATVLLEQSLLSEDRLEELRREVIETAVIEIFGWLTGEFCFDIGTEEEDASAELHVTTGINAQYLAMEASRQKDESGAARSGAVDDPLGFAELGDEIRGEGTEDAEDEEEDSTEIPSITEDDSIPAADFEETEDLEPLEEGSFADAILEEEDPNETTARSLLASSEVLSEGESIVSDEEPVGTVESTTEMEAEEANEAEDELQESEPEMAAAEEEPLAEEPDSSENVVVAEQAASEEEVAEAEETNAVDESIPADSFDSVDEGDESRVVQVEFSRDGTAPSPPQSVATGPLPPVILLDAHLPALEWVKGSISESFEHVHIFQRTNLAVGRVRQYLARGETPLLILSRDIPPDSLTGAKTPETLVGRLKNQVSRMLILTLVTSEDEEALEGTEGVLEIPPVSQLLDAKRAEENDELRTALNDDILYRLRRLTSRRQERRAVSNHAPIGTDVLQRLRDASASLREASSRGDVLESMMRFVGDHFSRVALFLVRDDMAVGMSQIGLERAEGPNDEEIGEISLVAREPAWFKAVFDTRAPVCGAPSNDGDRKLASLIGRIVPDQAYVAPIESGDQIVALLYGDNLPSRAPIGDTSALEVLLHQTGLALERSLLERLTQNEAK